MGRMEIKRLTNANIYIDGNNTVGKVEECTLPVIKSILSDLKALGLAGKGKLPTGGFEEMTAKLKWNAPYKEMMKLAANPFAARQIQIRGNVDNWEGGSKVGEEPYVVFLTGTFVELPLGAFKPNETVELESVLNVSYVKQVIGGETVVEASLFSNTWNAGEEDLLAGFAANTGA